MSRQNKNVSVQPENRTYLEEALEFAWQNLIDNLNVPYPKLKQPLETPPAFLDLLAQERGVLDYQPGDTQKQQRRTTQQAFYIHEHAGTRRGLKNAVNALEFDCIVTKGNKPYTVAVSAEIAKDPLTAARQQRLELRVAAYQSERDRVGVEIVRGSTSSLRVGVLSEVGIVNDCVPYTSTRSESDIHMRIGTLSELILYNDSEAARNGPR